jgi:hypothetical protein
MLVVTPYCVAIEKLLQPQKDHGCYKLMQRGLSHHMVDKKLVAIAAIATKYGILQHISCVALGRKSSSDHSQVDFQPASPPVVGASSSADVLLSPP